MVGTCLPRLRGKQSSERHNGYSEPMPRGNCPNILGFFAAIGAGVNARADASEQFVINWNEQRMQSPAWQRNVL